MNNQMALRIITAFIGYLIGRFGHAYLNVWLKNPPSPHHWIYGLILIIIGIFYNELITYLGIGLFISDLGDFLKLRFYGKDKPGKKRFWHID